MRHIIGFANKYYTLWNHASETIYTMDAYGKYHATGTKHKYDYLKNVSTDLEKVQRLFPNVAIDDTLRGRTSSFEKSTDLGLPSCYFPNGKYRGSLVDEIAATDLSYCLWYAQNVNNETAGLIKISSPYVSYTLQQEAEKNDLLASSSLVQEGQEVELDFQSNGYNLSDDQYSECYSRAFFNGTPITVRHSGARLVSGMYPYVMPAIDGRTQKTKNKTLKVKVKEVLNTSIENGVVKQIISIA